MQRETLAEGRVCKYPELPAHQRELLEFNMHALQTKDQKPCHSSQSNNTTTNIIYRPSTSTDPPHLQTPPKGLMFSVFSSQLSMFLSPPAVAFLRAVPCLLLSGFSWFHVCCSLVELFLSLVELFHVLVELFHVCCFPWSSCSMSVAFLGRAVPCLLLSGFSWSSCSMSVAQRFLSFSGHSP